MQTYSIVFYNVYVKIALNDDFKLLKFFKDLPKVITLDSILFSSAERIRKVQVYGEWSLTCFSPVMKAIQLQLVIFEVHIRLKS